MTKIFTILFFILAGCGVSENKYPTKEALVSAIVKAHNAKSTKEYIHTFHPKCKSRMTENEMPFFNTMFDKSFANPIPSDCVIKYTTNTSNLVLPFKDKFDYPVEPNIAVTISFNKTEYSSVSKSLWLSNDEYGWFQITGIPHIETVKQFQAMQIKKKELERDVEHHIDKLTPEVFEQIINILKNDKSLIKAHKLHMSKTKTDKTFSIMVVKKIRKKENLEW